MSSTLSIPHQVATRPAHLEDVAAWTLRRPLSLALGLLCSFQIVAWAPNYLTWPWWADHDVFATAARCWEAGIRPYRDFQGNNFPATIYVFWALGKLCGWGRTPPFYAFDAVLVLVFGLALVAWSTRRLGRALPGLVGYALFLSYYLNLNYTQAAQRDWHGPFFLVGAILLAQARPGRVVGGLAGLLTAAGLAFRPQVVLLLPALFLAFDESARRPGESLGRNARPLAFWAVGAVAGMFLVFLPLLRAGLFDDFLRSLRLVSYGGGYNRVSLASLLDQTLYALRPLRVAAVPTAVLLLAPAAAPDDRRLGRTWPRGPGRGAALPAAQPGAARLPDPPADGRLGSPRGGPGPSCPERPPAVTLAPAPARPAAAGHGRDAQAAVLQPQLQPRGGRHAAAG